MQLHGAKYGVLITKSEPPGYKHPYIVEEQGTIYIIESRSLRGIKALSEILMHLLVSIYKEKAKSSNTKEREMVLNTHFSSDEGIEALKSLIKNIIEEDEEIEKRDSTHQVEMKRRKDKQLEIKDNFKKLFLPLLGIKAIRESTRDTPLLSLEEDF